MNDSKDSDRLTLMQVFVSSLQAVFGVQKSTTRERDFQKGTAGQFIIVGLTVVIGFVLLLVGLVAVVMHFAV